MDDPIGCFCFEVALLSHLVYEDVVGDTERSLAKIEKNKIHCFFFIRQANHLIVEVYQFGEEQIACIKSVLTTPACLLVLNEGCMKLCLCMDRFKIGGK